MDEQTIQEILAAIPAIVQLILQIEKWFPGTGAATAQAITGAALRNLKK